MSECLKHAKQMLVGNAVGSLGGPRADGTKVHMYPILSYISTVAEYALCCLAKVLIRIDSGPVPIVHEYTPFS